MLAELRREGATDQELTLLSQTAREVGRLDASFRPFLPSVGRPSKLYARVDGSAEALERVEVGGAAVVVARGEFRL